MRERTTWDRSRIASDLRKVADDPRAMNQDHFSQQPAADAYALGGPSDFAEDVAPSAGSWKSEQGPDGNTKRNAIGMPEMRADSLKSAALDPELVHRKASLATKIARAMLSKTASEEAIEDQAVSLMSLTASDLTETLSRLAAQQEDEDEDEDGQQKQAGDEEDEEDEEEAPSAKQAKKAEDEDSDEETQQASKQAKKAEDEDSDEETQQASKQAKKAGQMPPQFKENAEKKKEEAAAAKKDEASKEAKLKKAKKAEDEEGEQVADEGQQKQASQMSMLAQQMQDAVACGDMTAQQQAVQAMQQLMGQGQQMPVQSQQQQLANDDLMDQMLAEQDGQMVESDIEMDSPQMDVGDIQLTDEDAILGQVFASGTEVQSAMRAASLQGLGPAPTGLSRTASTRTVGTRPTSGVSTLGGATASGAASSEASLSSLWQSAPDVSGAF